MDSFEKGFSSPDLPPNPKPSASPMPSFSGETKENDVNHDQMGFNSKKPLTKRFKSPTISAISKVTVPRKKIQAEKNESLTSYDNTHLQKSPILESRSGLLYSGSKGSTSHCDRGSSHAISACNCISATDDNQLNTCFADASAKPYDPLTNYLSPRPKYLRYKPNRRREILQNNGIFNSQNSKIVDEEKSCDCDQEESFASPIEGSSHIVMVTSKRNHNVCQDADEVEEEEETEYLRYKPNRRLEILQNNGIFNSQNSKIVDEEKSCECDQEESLASPIEGSSHIVMVTSKRNHNVCQDADEDEDEEEEETDEVEDAKSWSLKGLVKFLLLLIVIGLSTSYISSMNSPRPLPVVQAIGGLKEGYHRIRKHLFEAVYTNLHNVAWRNGSGMQPGDGQTGFLGFNLKGDHEFGMVQLDLDDEEELEEISDDIIEMPEPPKGEFEDSSEDDESDEGLNRPDWKISENNGINSQVKEIEAGSDQLPVCESAQTDAAPDQELNKVEENSERLQQCASLERYECFRKRMDETESASGNGLANLIYKGNQLENDHKADQFQKSVGEKAEEEMAGTRLERAEVTTTSREDESIRHIVLDVKSMKDLKYMNLGSISVAAIWFSMFSIVLASVVYIYFPRVIPTPGQYSQLEVSDRKKNLIQAQECVQVEHMEERAESIVKPSSVSFSFEKATRDLTYIQGPDVELLGEFVIGEFSSSLRSCNRKGRATETEESINPISHLESPAHPVALSQTPSVSISYSPSYGSFTAEKIILKTEEGRERNVKVITTPVRRSSRIRKLSSNPLEFCHT